MLVYPNSRLSHAEVVFKENPRSTQGLCYHPTMRQPPRMIWVYILQCADGSYYTGTHRGEGMEDRVAEHQTGSYGGYTAARRPVKLLWADWTFQFDDAVATERRIKGWTRAKKEAFIAGDWKRLKLLSKRRGGPEDS